jgi:hypothetical protein
MRKTALALALIFALLFPSVIAAQLVKVGTAQTYGAIKIKPDGSVEGTDKIQRQGNVYTLTGNLSDSIEVQKGNIVIDGAGHALQGIDLVGTNRSHWSCAGVLVKNSRIRGSIAAVGASNHSFINNYFESGIMFRGSAKYIGNLIKHNTLSNVAILIDYNPGGLDVITENNLINARIYIGVYSDAPILERNYWSNYVAKYPDAKEKGNTGIWDTPYVDDAFEDSALSCIDYYPLTHPLVISTFPDTASPVVSVVSPENKIYSSSNVSLAVTVNEPVVWTGYSLDGQDNITVTENITLAELPNGLHSLVVFASDLFGNMGVSETVSFTIAVPEPLPTVPIAVSVVAVAVVVAGLLVYFKKRRR